MTPAIKFSRPPRRQQAPAQGSRASTLLWLGMLLSILFPSWAMADGSLEALNVTHIPLDLRLSTGQLLGTHAPGQARLYTLPEGDVGITALRPDGSVYVDVHIKISAGGLTRWEITPMEGILDVRNNSSKHVFIEINEQTMGEVEAGKALKLEGIRPGRLLIQAVDEKGALVQRTVLELMPAGTQVWILGQEGNAAAGIPVLRVRNFSGERALVLVNGESRLELAPGELSTLVGFNPGEVSVVAQRPSSHEPLSEIKLQFNGGETKTWTIPSPTGLKAIVEVNNQTAVPLKICVDGAFCLKLKAKARLQYDAISTGRHVFQAYQFGTETLIDSLDATISGGNPYQWDIESRTPVPATTPDKAPAKSTKAKKH